MNINKKLLVISFSITLSLVVHNKSQAQFVYDFTGFSMAPTPGFIPGVAAAGMMNFGMWMGGTGFTPTGSPPPAIFGTGSMSGTGPAPGVNSFFFNISPDPVCPACVVNSITFDVVHDAPFDLVFQIFDSAGFGPTPITLAGFTPGGLSWTSPLTISVPLGYTLAGTTTFSIAFDTPPAVPPGIFSVSIDNVRVDVVCVPEPAHAGIAIIALLGVVTALKLRKKPTAQEAQAEAPVAC